MQHKHVMASGLNYLCHWCLKNLDGSRSVLMHMRPMLKRFIRGKPSFQLAILISMIMTLDNQSEPVPTDVDQISSDFKIDVFASAWIHLQLTS